MKQSIATDSLKLSLSKIITTTISLVVAMLLSRFRTLEEYGTYSQLLVVINIFTTLFAMGMPNSVNYFLARAEDEKEKQRFLSTYYTLNTLIGIVTGLILMLSTPLIAEYFSNPVLKGFWYFLAVFPWTNIILTSIENVLIVYKKATLLMVFRITNSIMIILAIMVVQILKMDFYTYMIIYVAEQTVFAFFVYIIVKNTVGKIKFLIDKTLISTILKFSIPVGLASVLGILKSELDKLVIGWFYDTAQLGIYANAAKEIPVNMIAAALTAVLMPQIVRLLKKDKREEAIKIWSDATSLSYLIICFFAIGLFVFAPDVMTLLYSTKYVAGTPVFRVYSLVLLFRCTYFGMVLNSLGRTKVILYNSIFALTANVILNVVFYYLFGFTGPAIATFVATLLSAGHLLIRTSQTVKMPLKKIFPWREIAIITLANIVLGVILYFSKQWLPLEKCVGEIIESIILGVIWGAVLFGIFFKFIKNKWKALSI